MNRAATFFDAKSLRRRSSPGSGLIVKPIGRRLRRTPFWNSRVEFFTDACVFTLGVAGAYSANIVGSLPGDEILLFPLLPVLLLAKGSRAFNRRYLLYYILTGAWLLGTLIADIYAESPTISRMKGTARVVFFLLDFTALAILINDRTRRLIIFAMSIAIVQLIGSWQFTSEFLLQWKFGISQAVAIVALVASSRFYARRRYSICFLISLVLAGLNLVYGFRSQLLVVLVSAVLILPLFDQARILHSGSRSPTKVFVLLALAGGAAYAANAAIKYAAKGGLFDESTQVKFESQESGDYGVLVGGRPETLVAIRAIIDNPIIGHGSFPYGPQYLQMEQDIRYEHGYSDTDEPEAVEFQVIPTHSHLTMAWVESGILGGVCWIYIFVIAVRAIVGLSTSRPNLAPLYCYLLVGFLWDILYSPFGSVNRIWGAFYILLSYNILKNSAAEAVLIRRQRAKYVDSRQKLRLPRVAIQ